MTDLIHLHADPNSYFDVRDKQEGREIDRNKLAATLRGHNISAQNAALDREIKRAELENKKLDRQAQNATNELRKQALVQQIAANQQKIDEANEKKRIALINDRKRIDIINYNADRLAQQAQSILDNPYLEWTVGAGSIMPNIPGTVRADLAAQISNLKDQIGLQTLSSMKELSANGASGLGNTTNREFGSLQNLLGNLNEKQSPEALRKTLQNIIKNAFTEVIMAINEYSEEQLFTALRNADSAGNKTGAQRIAGLIQQRRSTQNQESNPIAEAGKGLLQTGVNAANIIPEITDAFMSGASWAGNQLGIGDRTYTQRTSRCIHLPSRRHE